MNRLTLIAVALALPACVDQTEIDTNETTQLAAGCPLWGCGENSSTMGPWEFHELNTAGLPNLEDIRVLNFQLGGNTYTPQVVGTELRITSGSTTLGGTAVQGGWFNLQTPSGVWKLKVMKVNPGAVVYWVGPATSMYTYELKYEAPGMTNPEPVCHNPPNRDSGEGITHTWKAPLEAILFTGDRYDRDHKEVSTLDTANWFNIACAGSALAKLHLNRHTTAGTTFGWSTAVLKRQAMLKMYTSDICGNGYSWTNAGVPLHWQDNSSWMMLTGTEWAFEARWTAYGAACIDTHRLGSLYTDPVDGFPGMCNVPACNGDVTAPTFPRGVYFNTAVPGIVP